LVLRSQNSRTVGSRPTNPYTHRKACSRPFVWCRARLTPRSTFDSGPVGAPNRLDLKFERVTKSDRYGPRTRERLEQAYTTTHPSKGLLKAFRLVPGSTQSALNFGFWTRWRAQQVGLAGFLYVSLELVLRSQNSTTVGSRPTNPYTHRKACSRPFVWCRGPLCRRSGFECRPVRTPSRFDLKFKRVTKSDR
jgi:hypothetical protein